MHKRCLPVHPQVPTIGLIPCTAAHQPEEHMPYPSPTHFLMASLVIQVGLDCSSMSGSICHTIFSTEAATCGHMCSVKGGGGLRAPKGSIKG